MKWLLPALAVLASPAMARQSQAPACVLAATVESPEALEDGTIIFRGHTKANQSWIGHFKGGRCPSMNQFSVVRVDRIGNRYCEGDVVRAINPPTPDPGPACTIDALVPAAL